MMANLDLERRYTSGHNSTHGMPLPDCMVVWPLRPRIGFRIVMAIGISASLFVLLHATFLGRLHRHGPGYGHFDKTALPGVFPAKIGDGTRLSADFKLCSVCQCDAADDPWYEPSGQAAQTLPPRPSGSALFQASDAVNLNEFLRLALLDMYCSGQHLTPTQKLNILRRATSALDEVASWYLGGLQLGKPTVYLTTASSPNSKAGKFRPQYFRRHAKAIRSALRNRAVPGSQGSEFQLVWIVAEDEVSIDPRLSHTLRQMGIPYIYFSYGLTKSWGNAQKNAVLQIVHALSGLAPPNANGTGILGHGPVYGLDDDNKILPDLLPMLTRVVRCGVFPVGNIGPGGWESPTVDDEGVVTGSNSPWQRPFAFDYGAFAFNSSLLGSAIPGPNFWPWEEFAGESEFLNRIVGHVSDLEPLCGTTEAAQKSCQFVWHNEPLTKDEKGKKKTAAKLS